MKKQFLFLAVIACLSLTSVSVDASPPTDVGYHTGPTIQKQTAAVTPHEMIAITPIEYSFEYGTILAQEDYATQTKADEGYTSCAMSTTTKDVQVVDTSTRMNNKYTFNNNNYQMCPELNSKYCEGRATEYRNYNI